MSETVGSTGCHRWVAVSGTNDYECDACGARKLDNGEVEETW